MLGQRVITAVVLLIVLAAVLAAPGPLPLALLLLIFGIAGLFEWWRLTLARPTSSISQGDGLSAAQGSGWLDVLSQGDTGWRLLLRAFASLFAIWLVIRLLLDYAVLGGALRDLFGGSDSSGMGFGTSGWIFALQVLFGRLWVWSLFGWLIVVVYLFIARTDKSPFSLLLTAFGLVAVPAACTALMSAHARGVVYLLSLLAIVWVADIGAYFVGRKLGGKKLAPRISPGKTLSGALGGMVAAVIWVWASSLMGTMGPLGYSTFGADLVAGWTLPGALLLAALLAWLSVAGDLFESLLKRRAGRKDSSNLLPGHGGVFDRIDAVLPVAPLAMLLVV
nr:phosphatidate cytidylyltransferase [Pseudomonas sp.]